MSWQMFKKLVMLIVELINKTNRRQLSSYCCFSHLVYNSKLKKCFAYSINIIVFQLAVLTLVYGGGLAAQRIPERRLVSRSSRLSETPTLAASASEIHGDHVPAETGFSEPIASATGHHGSKYFQ